jgi:hypothetical protein
MELTSEIIESAITKARVSRGKNKGRLKAKCPKVNTPEAAAWQAIMTFANPYKIGLGHLMFMDDENLQIYNYITEVIKVTGLDVRDFDRDRKALDSLGVW